MRNPPEDARWLAVYGAALSLLVRDSAAEGNGPPGDCTMQRLIEEAEAQADYEAFMRPGVKHGPPRAEGRG